MPLPLLLTEDVDERSLESYAFAHARDHEEIQQALAAKGVQVQVYQLDPLPPRSLIQKWLLDHQQAHNDMNTPLALDGVDISVLDFNDRDALRAWMWENFIEHLAVRAKLNI